MVSLIVNVLESRDNWEESLNEVMGLDCGHICGGLSQLY